MDQKANCAEDIILVNHLSPGDVVVMTCAIECIARQHPGRYRIGVDTSVNAVFENNPHVDMTLKKGRRIATGYPLIHKSSQRNVHFVQGYIEDVAEALKIKLDPEINRPYIYLSDDEKRWISQVQELTGKPTRFALVCSGIKSDFTTKAWGTENYQAVVDHFRGRIQFVQVGKANHTHVPLRNVIQLTGKTDDRQFIRLCWHAECGLGGVSYMHHVFAAFEKPFVCVASGMEATSWERYNTETFLTKGHCLPCGRPRACWKMRTVPLRDGHKNDRHLCEQPVLSYAEPIPRCMALVTPAEVIAAIESYYAGGVCRY